jgi:putative MFS transporter
MLSSSTLSDRRGLWAFILGVIAVTAGVLLHIPMFLMGRHNHFILAGMPMGWDMVAGMVAIVGGLAIAAYGLLPRNIAGQLAASHEIVVTPPEDAPLTVAHWTLMFVLVIALVIDIMKPATLGFVLPGMMSEYRWTRRPCRNSPSRRSWGR